MKALVIRDWRDLYIFRIIDDADYVVHEGATMDPEYLLFVLRYFKTEPMTLISWTYPR